MVASSSGVIRRHDAVWRVCCIALGVLVGAGAAGCSGEGTQSSSSPPPSTSGPASSTTAASSSTTVTTVATTTSAPSPPVVPAGLQQGDRGPEVVVLQQRLAELGYWSGAADGEFGTGTFHAVVALQKVAGLSRDGIVGAATQAALDAGVRPAALTATGYVVEIHLTEQVLAIVRDGHVETVFDTSTGKVAGTTPRGTWTVSWQIDGFRQSALGLLYRPKYFHNGVAIHGYTSVPPYPASHGCVRVTYPAMDYIWEAGLIPIGTTVVVGG